MNENVNFHMTFPPTPAYIGRILKIADGRIRTTAEIAEETGIPEGTSSGKVRPHVAYAGYMGLIDPQSFSRTKLGQIVKVEDCMITEKLTQLICHANLTSQSGAVMWRFLFRQLLPENQGHISSVMLAEAMQLRFGLTVKYAPAITMYTKQFTKLNLLQSDGDQVAICPLPVEKDMLYVYGYALLREWEQVMPDNSEITATELEKLAFAAVFGWSPEIEYEVLQMLAGKGIIGINSQLVPFTVKKLTTSSALIPKLYSLLF